MPQFQGLRAAVQQNPELLPSLLQEIGHTNPGLLQVRTEDRQDYTYSTGCLS